MQTDSLGESESTYICKASSQAYTNLKCSQISSNVSNVELCDDHGIIEGLVIKPCDENNGAQSFVLTSTLQFNISTETFPIGQLLQHISKSIVVFARSRPKFVRLHNHCLLITLP